MSELSKLGAGDARKDSAADQSAVGQVLWPQPLIEGFLRFRESHFPSNDIEYSRLFAEGQKPKFLIVGCCDSRVDPAIIFNCAPGELFVVRNVANIVCNLRVEHIVVLGHQYCGGIQALLQTAREPNPDSFIDDWMRMVDSARVSVERDFAGESIAVRSQACEQRAILVSLKNLLTYPWITERIADNTLRIHGWYFDISQGQLLGYNATTDQFEPL
jgi:carbonic anhydrase